MVTANPHGNWEAHCERMQQEADESLARSGHREHAGDGPIAEGWHLTVGHGHSGFGIYAHIEEYPEEGAIFWRSLNDVQTEAYAEGRKDEAEEHSAPLLEALRYVETQLASNLAFTMDGTPETGWDAVAAFLIRDIHTAIAGAYPSAPQDAANDAATPE